MPRAHPNKYFYVTNKYNENNTHHLHIHDGFGNFIWAKTNLRPGYLHPTKGMNKRSNARIMKPAKRFLWLYSGKVHPAGSNA